MLKIKQITLVIATLLCCGFIKISAENCMNAQDCKNNPECQCWCSQICEYRDKHNNDNPIYIENDPNEKYCYCKPWDRKYYNRNCVSTHHKNRKKQRIRSN